MTRKAYTEDDFKILKKQLHVLPLILGGDFKTDFDKDEGLRLVQFLKQELNLDFVSGRALETTSPSSVSWGKLPTWTTQPTSRIGTLTSTFAGLKDDTSTKDSLAADQR
ncbi:hypothetical protein TNCV_939821 [Trichonephila clavipes]|nr:hypothetical protein TNCV_939821 [Trichonephila clavipes]